MRSVGRSLAMTWAGEGKAGCVSGKSAVNFLRIEAAAAPETFVRFSQLLEVRSVKS